MKKKYATDRMIKSRCEFYKNFISENSSDQKKLFAATKKLLNHTDEVPYPPFNDKIKFSNENFNIQVKRDNMINPNLHGGGGGGHKVPALISKIRIFAPNTATATKFGNFSKHLLFYSVELSDTSITTLSKADLSLHRR